VPTSIAFPLKLTFFVLVAGWMEGPTFFSGASAILLTLGVEVEGPVGRAGVSGVGGMAAGDGLALGGFWPETFLLLCAKLVTNQSQTSYKGYEDKSWIFLTLALAG
jgi:hypothetical protein